MWSHYFWFFTLLILVSSYVQSFKEGDSCNLLDPHGLKGVCTKFWYCNRQSLYSLLYDHRCGAQGFLTCCEKRNVLNQTTTSTKIGETVQTGKPYGWLSKKKCKEYSKLRDELYRNLDKCDNSIKTKIIGGERAFDGEFPHMAIYQSAEKSENSFTCGASLISNQYLLTAAHCGRKYKGGRVVILGSNERDSNSGISVNVSKRIIHPDYTPSQHYNDIALLRLLVPVNFTQYIWPACLQTDDYVKQKKAIATGWGHTTFSGIASNYLLKVTLPLANISDCKEANPPKNSLRYGVDEDTMLCAGRKNLGKDTCNGDSGGPLQTLIRNFRCLYTIAGITSFGYKPCGEDIGVYTKVSSFIPWIESIVWKDEK